jgi:hypothetical protein
MKRYCFYCLLLIIVEVLASFAIWHGTPTDWAGERLHFWGFEGVRLVYWAIFVLLSGTLWTGLQRLLSQRKVRNALAAACLIGIEVATSLTFWKRLAPDQAGYLGWPNLTRYVLDHLAAWSVLWALGLGVWHLLERVASKRSVDTIERKV